MPPNDNQFNQPQQPYNPQPVVPPSPPQPPQPAPQPQQPYSPYQPATPAPPTQPYNPYQDASAPPQPVTTAPPQPQFYPPTAQPMAGTPPPTPYAAPLGPSAVVPQKYRIFQAIADTLKALKNNLLTFIIVTIVAIVMVIVLTIVLSIPLSGVIKSGVSSGSSLTLQKLIGSVILLLILSTLWTVILSAFLTSVMALAVNDGADGKRSSIGGTLASGFRVTPRVVAADLLVYLVVCIPIIVILLLTLALSTSSGLGVGLFLIGGLISLAWILAVALRFALVPYIAIFEPQTSIFHTLSRSNHLLRKGGIWFLIKTILLVIVIDIVTIALAAHIPHSLAVLVEIIVFLFFIVVELSVILLYRNRRLVRDKPVTPLPSTF